MGFEYFARGIAVSAERVESLREALSQMPAYVLLPTTESQAIGLRFARYGNPTPDVEMQFSADVCVLFHSATAKDRETLLGIVVSHLRADGLDVELVEE